MASLAHPISAFSHMKLRQYLTYIVVHEESLLLLRGIKQERHCTKIISEFYNFSDNLFAVFIHTLLSH
jgi:hypothetical protein